MYVDGMKLQTGTMETCLPSGESNISKIIDDRLLVTAQTGRPH